jgi:hypothetical protein
MMLPSESAVVTPTMMIVIVRELEAEEWGHS